jgi:hypothetical protein
MSTIVAPSNSASKWQMGFNAAFKGLMMGAVQWEGATAQYMHLVSHCQYQFIM